MQKVIGLVALAVIAATVVLSVAQYMAMRSSKIEFEAAMQKAPQGQDAQAIRQQIWR